MGVGGWSCVDVLAIRVAMLCQEKRLEVERTKILSGGSEEGRLLSRRFCLPQRRTFFPATNFSKRVRHSPRCALTKFEHFGW